MAYSTATPPQLLIANIEQTIPAIWTYTNSDTSGTVSGAGYISNAKQLGMKVGDILFYSRTGTVTAFSFVVVSFTGNAATLGTAVQIG